MEVFVQPVYNRQSLMAKIKDQKGPALTKSPTGITGFDQITNGGLPQKRTTLVCGGPGCGKSLFGMEFLVRGITDFKENGVFISFEEDASELQENFSSLGYNLGGLIMEKKLIIDYFEVERVNIDETGDYDLQALFIRLADAIDSIGAKRVVIDTIEALFTGFKNHEILRSEFRRLFRWLKSKGVTTVLTGEKGEGSLTRYGLEEYVSDCVIFLDHRIENQISTRRLRVVKYRGSFHGTNEYPFLIDEAGLSVLPVTSVGLDYRVASERISTGIKQLDEMFDGKGFYKGSTVLISGSAGTGKTSIASEFALSACKNGQKCLYFAFEESSDQIIRNMKSIDIHFDKWVKNNQIKFHTVRPNIYGLEMHLVMFHKLINEFEPDVVILDPISNLISQGDVDEVKTMLLRLIDLLKLRQVTTLMTNLTSRNSDFERVEINVSSIADTWIMLRDVEINGELRRGIYVVKSRGMSHSKKVKEFLITDKGIKLLDSEDLERSNERINL